jgi:hypothetical protein
VLVGEWLVVGHGSLASGPLVNDYLLVEVGEALAELLACVVVRLVDVVLGAYYLLLMFVANVFVFGAKTFQTLSVLMYQS